MSKTHDKNLKKILPPRFDVSDAAEFSGFSEEHVRRLCRERKIDHHKRGSQYLFTADQVFSLYQFVPARRPR